MIGRTLSHYKVLEEISRGGMGIVYKALDLKLNREVALKVLPPAIVSDPERKRRFVQEAQAAAALKHPNIAHVYEIDEVDGVDFIVMELIEGEKLSDTLKRGSLPVAEALGIAIEVAEGLATAHEKGVVHRDLKPANIMISEQSHPKIIDFGLAKLLEPQGKKSSEAMTALREETSDGRVLGTVSYMSPEQARAQKVDHRSDIFSLGVVLYELLTGRLPFQGPSVPEILNAIINTPVPALGGDSVLARIVHKCLAKAPHDRYQTMKDLVLDLKMARRASDSAISRPVVALRSARSGMWLAIGVVAVLLLGTSAHWLLRVPSSTTESTSGDVSRKPTVAVLFFDNQSGDPEYDWLSTALTDMLVTDMSQSPNLQVLGTDRLYQIMEELNRLDERVTSFTVVEEVVERSDVDKVVLGSFVSAGETIRINVRVQDAGSGDILSAESVEGQGKASIFAMVDDLTQRIKASLDIPQAAEIGFDRGLSDVSTASPEAYRHYVEGLKLHFDGRFREAIRLFERAVELDPEFALALARLGNAHGNLGHAMEGHAFQERALDHADRLPGRERYYIEGNYYSSRAETYPQAIAAFQRAVQLYPDHGAARNNLARRHLDLLRLDDAIEHFEQLRAASFSFSPAYRNLADAYRSRGELERGLEVLESFLRRYPGRPVGRLYLASYLMAADRLDEAEAELDAYRALSGEPPALWFSFWTLHMLRERWEEASVAVSPNAASNDLTVRAGSLRSEALVELYRGKHGEALRSLEQAIRIPNAPSREIAQTRNLRAHVLLETEQPARALADAQVARRAGPGHFSEWDGIFLAARAHAALGQWEDAESATGLLRENAERLSSPRETLRHRHVLGELALARGDLASAIELLTEAASLLAARGLVSGRSLRNPRLGTFYFDPRHVPVWFALASAHLRAGNEGDAREWFQRIADSGIEHVGWPILYARSFYFLAKIHDNRGDSEKAREYYQHFVDLWGDGDVDRERVEEAASKL